LLGEVLKEQVGDDLFTAVEELRSLLIEHRERHARQDATAGNEQRLLNRAQQIVSRLSIAEARHMTRAFAIYFELTNLAETNHRKRRRRAAQASPERLAQPGSFLGTLRRLRAAGIDVRQALAWLRRVEVTLVFTAHPTEVARRTVLFKRQRIAEELERLDRLPLTERQAESMNRRSGRDHVALANRRAALPIGIAVGWVGLDRSQCFVRHAGRLKRIGRRLPKLTAAAESYHRVLRFGPDGGTAMQSLSDARVHATLADRETIPDHSRG
jgi:phosphoenolpyruvate carboxylase